MYSVLCVCILMMSNCMFTGQVWEQFLAAMYLQSDVYDIAGLGQVLAAIYLQLA